MSNDYEDSDAYLHVSDSGAEELKRQGQKFFSKSLNEGRNIWRQGNTWYYSDTGEQVPQWDLGPRLQNKQ